MTLSNRETWLNNMAALMAPRFAALGHALPKFRVSVGFTSAGMGGNSIGECWNKTVSGDDHFEIFLRPDRSESMEVTATLAHELAHAAVGLQEGHKGNFATVVLAIGLKRPLTATTAGPEFIEWVTPFLEQLGPIPHAALTWRLPAPAGNPKAKGAPRVKRGSGGMDEAGEEPTSSRKPKQSTRLIKAACMHEECGYTVRVTARWLKVGAPHCPFHGAMQADAGDEDANEDAGE